jgi:hypothetical protein
MHSDSLMAVSLIVFPLTTPGTDSLFPCPKARQIAANIAKLPELRLDFERLAFSFEKFASLVRGLPLVTGFQPFPDSSSTHPRARTDQCVNHSGVIAISIHPLMTGNAAINAPKAQSAATTRPAKNRRVSRSRLIFAFCSIGGNFLRAQEHTY